MNKYYLHDGYESSGPFDLEEIKTKSITKSTSVWCEGMADWTTAGEVDELKRILFPVQPPAYSKAIKPPTPRFVNNHDYSNPEDEDEESTKIFGLNRKHVLVTIGILIFLVLAFVANSYQDNRRSELDQKNDQTDAQNLQYDQKETEAQKLKMAEEERIERERIATEKKLANDRRLQQIKNLLAVDYVNLENAKNKFNDISSFQLFRTPEERDVEMGQAQNEVNRWMREIENLEKEAIRLNQN